MARIECRSSQSGVAPTWVEVENLSHEQVRSSRRQLVEALRTGQASDAVATVFRELTQSAPEANPSDLWHHVVYRLLLAEGWNDARWKRVSGFALERALVSIYDQRLKPYTVRVRTVPKAEANAILANVGVTDVKSTKVDVFFEGLRNGKWMVFGAGHVKSSIAERIQDDVPASLAFMEKGLLSILLTMDVKSYPPPHGNCVNYGELGGRSFATDGERERLKRNYIEQFGQFDALFSFNLRTPPSRSATKSGKRIYTISLQDKQPDALTALLVDRWASHPKAIDL